MTLMNNNRVKKNIGQRYSKRYADAAISVIYCTYFFEQNCAKSEVSWIKELTSGLETINNFIDKVKMVGGPNKADILKSPYLS